MNTRRVALVGSLSGVVLAVGVLAGGSTPTASATALHMAAGDAITVDCPTTPDIRPVSGTAFSVTCPGGSTSTPSTAPSLTPSASPTKPSPTPPPFSPTPSTSAPTPSPSLPSQPPIQSSTVYGSAIAGDTKANLRLDGNRVAHRFRASTTSTITSVRWQERGGSGYSLGTGGKIRVSLQADTPTGPSGVVLGTAGTYGPKVPSGGIFDAVALSGPVIAGQLYDIVFENTDPSPSKNYISVNELFVYSALTPRQPRFPDSDYAVLYGTSSWSVQSKYTADMDVSYADGSHDGQSYIGMIGINGMAVYAATISGSQQVRETLGAAPFAVSSASVRVRRASGTDPLTISLITAAGSVVGQGQVPASMVPQSAAGGDNGGSVWVTVQFPATAFSGGQLLLTTAAGSAYTAAPIRDGSDSGFAPSLGFPDGAFQLSTNNGGTWAAAYSANVLDLQFALRP